MLKVGKFNHKKMQNLIINHIKKSIRTKQLILNNPILINKIEKICDEIIKTYKRKNKVLIAGNGGSAADSQHIAGEFVSKFYFDRPGLSAVALTTDTSILTAIGNDYGYKKIFARQINAIGNSGDIFIGISTSGNSQNIIEALKMCQKQNIKTIGFLGANEGKMGNLCDFCVKVPSTETPRIQESHILIGHIICGIVEQSLFQKQ